MRKLHTTFILIGLLVFSSCSKKVPENFSYRDTLETLIFKYTSLRDISHYTGVPKNIIVGIADGQYTESRELNKVLYDLDISFKRNVQKAQKNIHENTEEIDLSTITQINSKNISLEKIKALEIKDHQRIQEAINKYIIAEFITREQTFIDSKFSIWKIPYLIWTWLTNSREEIITSWKKDLTTTIDINSIDGQTNQQIDSYCEYINIRRKNNAINTVLKGQHIHLSKDNLSPTNKEFQEKIIHRLNNEIYSTVYLNLLEIIIGAIVTYFLKVQLEKTIKQNDDMYGAFTSIIWKKQTNFWMRIFAVGTQLFNFYKNNKAEKKYRKQIRILNISLFIIFFGSAFFLFDHNSIKLEEQIKNDIDISLSNYLEKQNTAFYETLITQTNNL